MDVSDVPAGDRGLDRKSFGLRAGRFVCLVGMDVQSGMFASTPFGIGCVPAGQRPCGWVCWRCETDLQPVITVLLALLVCWPSTPNSGGR